MSIRLVMISEADLAALVAARSVIADAAHYPGRAAAIAAIDQIAACDTAAVRYDVTNRETAARLLDRAAILGCDPDAAAKTMCLSDGSPIRRIAMEAWNAVQGDDILHRARSAAASLRT